MKKKNKTMGVTLILERASAPVADIIHGAQFKNGVFTYMPPGDTQGQDIPYDDQMVKRTPDGLLMHYDLDKKTPFVYEGQCTNDGSYVVKYADGTVEEVEASKAELDADRKAGVIVGYWRSIFRRINGASLYQRRTSTNWDQIKREMMGGWLAILNRYAGLIIVVVLILLLIIGAAVLLG